MNVEASANLMIGQDTLVLETMHVTVNLPLQIGHAPAPVDKKEANGQNNLQTRSGEVAPVADVGKSEALHHLMQVLHVLSGGG